MPTFLELCRQVHQDCGIAGAISSVTGQTGMLKRVVDWTAKANRKLQRRKDNWKFLWKEWDLTLVQNIAEYPPPDNIDSFDQTSFWLSAGTTEAMPITYIDYKEWRDKFRHRFSETDVPSFVAIKPNRQVVFLPGPSAVADGLKVTADYWMRPVDLVSNGQISLIPEQFHDAIVTLARQYWAEYAHDNGAFQAAALEHELIYEEMKAHSLPGNEDNNKSESSIDRVIMVP